MAGLARTRTLSPIRKDKRCGPNSLRYTIQIDVVRNYSLFEIGCSKYEFEVVGLFVPVGRRAKGLG